MGFRVTCDLELADGSPVNRGGGGFEAFAEGQDGGGGFMSSSCCDRQGLTTATASVSVPADADWLLQDRGSWFLAYRVDGLERVGVSWKYRERRMGPGGPPMSTVLFVADDGALIGETTAGGPF